MRPGLQIKYKGWKQMNMVFLALVKRMGIGTGPLGVVGGFAPSGVGVSSYYVDEGFGVGALRKF